MEKNERALFKDMKQGTRFRTSSILSFCLKFNLLLAFYSFVGISIFAGVKLFYIFSDAAMVKDNYEDIVNNWSSDMIKQIFEVSPNEQCPGNSTELFRFQWQGTQEACSCSKTSVDSFPTLEKKVYKQLCNSTMMDAKCETIEGSPARPLFMYKDQKFCVQRMSETSYFLSANNMNSDGTCKEGYKSCGGKNNHLYSTCVNASLFDNGCPILDISYKQVDSSYVKIGNSNLYYSKNDNIEGSPYSEIKLTNTSICYSTPSSITNPTDSTRPSSTTTEPCNYGGPGFNVFDQGIEATTFLAKQSISLNTDTNPVIDQVIKPFKRGYYSFKPSCRKDLLNLIDHATISISPMRTMFLKGMSIFLIFTTSLGCFIFSLTLLIKPSSNTSSLFRYFGGIIVIVLNLVAVEMSYFVTSSAHDYFETLVNNKCGDNYTQPTFEKLALMTNLDTVFKRDVLVVLGSLLLAISFGRLVGPWLWARLFKAKPISSPSVRGSELTSIKPESQLGESPL